MADVRSQLVQAYNWIKEGKRAEAEALLIRILGTDEKNADAWWLLANTLTDPTEQAEALDQLLALRPNDEKGQKMMARLRGARPAPPPPPPPPPARPTARPAAPVEDDDPFGDVKSSDDDPFAEVRDSRRERAADDDEDPFAIVAEAKKKPQNYQLSAPEKRRTSQQSSGNNTIFIILGIVAVVVLIGCGACYVIYTRIQQGVQEVLSDPTLQAAFNDPTLQAALSDPTLQAAFQSGGFSSSSVGFASNTLPSDVTQRGALFANQPGRATVDTFTDDTWLLNADAGVSYTVDVVALDNDLDPQVAVYDGAGRLIGGNDDIDFMDNTNSRFSFVAANSGPHTILVSAFGSGGSYEVTVRR